MVRFVRLWDNLLSKMLNWFHYELWQFSVTIDCIKYKRFARLSPKSVLSGTMCHEMAFDCAQWGDSFIDQLSVLHAVSMWHYFYVFVSFFLSSSSLRFRHNCISQIHWFYWKLLMSEKSGRTILLSWRFSNHTYSRTFRSRTVYIFPKKHYT